MANISPTMLVADVFEQKSVLERKVAAAVTQALRDFEGATGFTPRAIDVRLAAVQRVGQSRPDYVVDGVEVDLDL